jgi:IclR family pca regulon transcriptional regulator
MRNRLADERDFITALARGLDVLEAFTAAAPAMTLSEVAAATSLSPATARRCLITLERLGYVRQSGRQFELTAKVLSIGASYFDSMNLAGVAQQVLQSLADALHHACSVTVLENNEVVYIAHAMSDGPSLARHHVGARIPAHATSTGHVLLAGLPTRQLQAFLAQAPFARYTANTPVTADELVALLDAVRDDGHAIVVGTVEYGAAAAAVPIHSPDGSVVAALNCSATAIREGDEQALRQRVPMLHAAARQVEQALTRFPSIERSA